MHKLIEYIVVYLRAVRIRNATNGLTHRFEIKTRKEDKRTRTDIISERKRERDSKERFCKARPHFQEVFKIRQE